MHAAHRALWAKRCGLMVTMEDHVLAGGFGSAVMESLNEQQIDVSVVRSRLAGRIHRAWQARERLKREVWAHGGGCAGARAAASAEGSWRLVAVSEEKTLRGLSGFAAFGTVVNLADCAKFG